jgi:hypothetical protein
MLGHKQNQTQSTKKKSRKSSAVVKSIVQKKNMCPLVVFLVKKNVFSLVNCSVKVYGQVKSVCPGFVVVVIDALVLSESEEHPEMFNSVRLCHCQS